MKKILLFLALTVCVGGGGVFSQVKTVTGTVMDQNGNQVPYASVTVKSSRVGTVAKEDGSFLLNLPPGAKSIVVSAIGMADREIAIGAASKILVLLSYKEADMEDVVTVGYGSAKKVGNVVGAVARVGGSALQNRPTGNVLDALQGKASGVQVYVSSGEPSALASVRLHGSGSLGAGPTPLFVIDGIPVDASTLRSLSPNDIEDLTVLKDASAASIYGSRAANGVIYITTKKGKAGESATITINSQYGVSNIINVGFFDKFFNSKQLTDYWLETKYKTQAQIDDIIAKYPYDTKWSKVYYKENVPNFQTDVSISGGAGKTKYYVSGGYLKNNGLAYRSGYERYTMRSNLTTTAKKWLQLGLVVSGSIEKYNTNPYGGANANRGLGLLAQPFYSPVDDKGKNYELIPGWNRYHPQYLSDKNPSDMTLIRLTPAGYIQITPIKGLTLETHAGVDFYDSRETSHRLPSYIGSLNNGSTSESFGRSVRGAFTNTAEYVRKVNDVHSITALAGTEYIDYVGTGFSATSAGQTDDRLILLNNGPSNRDVSSYKVEHAFNSYFGRLEYNYNSKYFIEGSIRNDASSRFGRNHRNAQFWSAGVMWNVKKESFLKDVNWIQNLKVKISTGTSGNSDIGDYQSLALVSTNQYSDQTGWNINTPGDPNLTWEKQRLTNFTIDFEVLGRARVAFELYNRVTKSMLVNVPYPYTSGFSSITKNVGSLQNRGIDLSLDVDVLKTKKTIITPYVRFNYNKEKVLELFQGRQYWVIPNTGISWAVGQPRTYFFPVFNQVNPETGMPEWYLPNENPDEIVKSRFDKSKTTSTFSSGALQQSTGLKRYAPINGGFGLSASHLGISLQADFAYSLGKYLINNDRYFFENPTQFPGFNQWRTITDYWKNPGDRTRFPKYGVQFTQFDSRLIENASFVRLKTLSLGYSLPKSLLDKTHFFKEIKIFVIGRNLWTATKYTGPDPEVDSNLSLGAYPNTKQYGAGMQLQF